MVYTVKFTRMAFSDLETGAQFYKVRQNGLDKRFKTAIKETIDRIKGMPFAASVAYDDIRYKVVTKFPYVILYTIQGNTVRIIRIFNNYQQPTH